MSNPQKLSPTSFERFLDKYVLPNVPEPDQTAALMLPGIVMLAAIERLMVEEERAGLATTPSKKPWETQHFPDHIKCLTCNTNLPYKEYGGIDAIIKAGKCPRCGACGMDTVASSPKTTTKPAPMTAIRMNTKKEPSNDEGSSS